MAKKRVIKSQKLKKHTSNFGKINQAAFDAAYEAGKQGKKKNTPSNYFKIAARQVLK